MSTSLQRRRSLVWLGAVTVTVLLIMSFGSRLQGSPTTSPTLTEKQQQQAPSLPPSTNSDAIGQIAMALAILAKMAMDTQVSKKADGQRDERDQSRGKLQDAQARRMEVVEGHLLGLFNELQALQRGLSDHDRIERETSSSVDVIDSHLRGFSLRQDAQERRMLAIMDSLNVKDTEVR